MKRIRFLLGAGVLMLLMSLGTGYSWELDNMDDVSDWSVGWGGGAGTNNSISVNTNDYQEGAGSGELEYDHTTNVGSDYVTWEKDIGDKNFANQIITFWLKQPNDTNAYLDLKLYNPVSYKYAWMSFPEGNAAWTYYSLSNANFSVQDGFDWAHIKLFRFESNGDVSSTATHDSYLADDIQIIPEPSTLLLLGGGGLTLIFLQRGRRRGVPPGEKFCFR